MNARLLRRVCLLFVFSGLLAGGETPGAEPASRSEQKLDRARVREELERAVRFFHEKVGVEGGYVWRYSSDLSKREGEGKVGPRTAWVQPPGTPFVGDGLLEIHRLTGSELALEAARACGSILVRGQLHSGGWSSRIDLDPEDRRRLAYRVDGKPRRKARDISTLDDDMTQSALRFLMRLDRQEERGNEAVAEAVRVGLDALLGAQFPSGGWPQVFTGSGAGGPPAGAPDLRASFSPSGEYSRHKEYWHHYTLNDQLCQTVVETLLVAHEVYGEPRYLEAARRTGDFLLLAQMPEPQPGWAQQYDREMRPTWARKFEPPAISGSEGPAVMGVLIDLARVTGERRYLEPVPRALEYYRRSRLEDGRLARFYELGTNRPLYFDRKYRLTHRDDDLPTHYSFQVQVDLDAIGRKYRRAVEALEAGKKGLSGNRSLRRPPEDAVRDILEGLDERGAWVTEGRLRFHGRKDATKRVIDPRVFVERATALARWLADA